MADRRPLTARFRARLLGLTLFPEVFALFLNIVYVKGILDISMRRQAQWHYQPELLEVPVAVVQA